MRRETGVAATGNGARYLQQLCKHWSHKLPVELDEGRGVVRFPEATAILSADPERLTVVVEAEDPETIERIKGVVASHLDRFAFREAPLPFEWRAG
jgi:hypothetical protein